MATKLIDADVFENEKGERIVLFFGREYKLKEGEDAGRTVIYDGWSGKGAAINPHAVEAHYKTHQDETQPVSYTDPFNFQNLDGSHPSF